MVRGDDRDEGEVEKFRSLVQAFVRDFGLLASSETPCGHPIPISYAHALMTLLERHRAREPMSQSALGEILGIDKSNVARLCGRMEDAGHVIQTRAPTDGRSRLLALTASGIALARQLDRASRARFRRIWMNVPQRRRAGLLDSLAGLNESLAISQIPKDES